MIYKISLEQTYEANRTISIEVYSGKELTKGEKAQLVTFAQAHVDGHKEDIGEEPHEESIHIMEPSVEEMVREIQQNGARIHQKFVVTIRCITPSEWEVGTTRDSNIRVYVVTATNLRDALSKMLEYQRSHQPARTEAKEDDWFYLTYSGHPAGKRTLHSSCFENGEDATREGRNMLQRKEAQSYRVHRARDVPACENTRQCPCCRCNVLASHMQFLAPKEGEPLKGQKFCQSCLPIIGQAVEIVGKRASSKERPLHAGDAPFCIVYPYRGGVETLLHETWYQTIQEAHAAGRALINDKVTSSYTVLREVDVPVCINTLQCPLCKRNVLYSRMGQSDSNGKQGCSKCSSEKQGD